jgi:hypothetical protein
VAVTTLAFWPVVRHLDSTVPGRPGDESSTARNYWADHALGKNPFTATRDSYLNAPEGEAQAPAVQIANALQPTFTLAAQPVAGWLGALNLFWLAGTAASLFAMFALLDSLGLHPVAAATGAVALAWSQWALEQIRYGHVAFAQLWIFPLVLGSLFWAMRGRAARAAVPGLALGLSFYAFSYLGLFASFLAAIVVCVARRSLDARRVVVGGTVTMVALLPVLLASKIAPSSALNLPSGSNRDLNGAPVHDYFVPSDHHAFYGRLVQGLFGTHEGENAIFFGYAIIALGLLGAGRVVRRWHSSPLAARVATVVIPVAFVASLPAYVPFGDVSVPFPDAAMVIGGFVQWWRIYTRFAVLVGFGLTILAAYVLDRMLRGRRRWPAMLLVAVVVIEAFPGAPFAATRLRAAPFERWLAAHPGGIVALYPLLTPDAPHAGTAAQFDNYVWGSLYEQVSHGHPLFALPRLEADADRATVTRVLAATLGDPRTPGLLAAEHVRYVIVRKDVYAELGLRMPRLPRGLVPLARLGGAEVFRVTAKPVSLETALRKRAAEAARIYAFGSPAVTFGPGFYGEEVYNGFHARWLSQDGTVAVTPGRAAPYLVFRMTFTGFSNLIPRRLTISDHGRSVASFLVPATQTTFTALVHLREAPTRLVFHAGPGPARLSATDRRTTSIYVEALDFDPVEVQTK